jgi:prepilin-type N-terminal cleavage/methylation domain-containing protein
LTYLEDLEGLIRKEFEIVMKRKRSFRRSQAGFSLVELLIVIAIIGILAAVAIPQFLETLKSGRETAVIKTLETIHTNQATYLGRRQRFATLKELSEDALLDSSYANNSPVNGYIYQIAPEVTADKYCVQATRVSDSTASRDFNIDQSGIKRFRESKSPSPVPCGEGTPMSAAGSTAGAGGGAQ